MQEQYKTPTKLIPLSKWEQHHSWPTQGVFDKIEWCIEFLIGYGYKVIK